MATETMNLSNLSKLAKYFSDEDAARGLLEEMRWGKTPTCPHCGGLEPYTLTAKPTSKKPGRKGLYKCKACRKQFTVTVGTVFEDSRIPISKWLLAIHLIASSKKGMSAPQIHRNLGISYKAAWFMMHRLRYAMKQGPLSGLMKGTVEIDETYVGGKQRYVKSGRPGSESNKTPGRPCRARDGARQGWHDGADHRRQPDQGDRGKRRAQRDDDDGRLPPL